MDSWKYDSLQTFNMNMKSAFEVIYSRNGNALHLKGGQQ